MGKTGGGALAARSSMVSRKAGRIRSAGVVLGSQDNIRRRNHGEASTHSRLWPDNRALSQVHKYSRVADMIVHFTRFHLDRTPRHQHPPEPHLQAWKAWRGELYPDEPEQSRLYFDMMYLDDHRRVCCLTRTVRPPSRQ